jgi:hypothetical protein
LQHLVKPPYHLTFWWWSLNRSHARVYDQPLPVPTHTEQSARRALKYTKYSKMLQRKRPVCVQATSKHWACSVPPLCLSSCKILENQLSVQESHASICAFDVW